MSFKAKFGKFIGFPEEVKFEDIIDIIKKFKIVFYLYILIVLIYIALFVVFRDFTDKVLGKEFSDSYSVSLVEDLIFFLFIGSVATIVSVIVSNKSPEDHFFDRRVRALINSKNVKNDDRVFDFIKANVSKLLAFNKSIKYEVFITDYHAENKTYSIINRRTHILTNMCKDKDFESFNDTLTITPDVQINNSYGKIIFLGEVHPNNTDTIINKTYDETDNFLFTAGVNVIPLNMPVSQDSEVAYKFTYKAYSSVGNIDELNSWLFFEASKYTKKVEFSIKNNLKNSKTIKYSLRRRSKNNEVDYLGEVNNVSPGASSQLHILHAGLLPGERVEFYIFD